MTDLDAEILTVGDLAKLFSCDTETVAARLINGDFPGVKVGRGWIIPKQALFQRLNEKAHEEAASRRLDLKNSQPVVNSVNRKASQTQLTTISVKPRGRVRRTPPPLPKIQK